jgi:hypothetical protein
VEAAAPVITSPYSPVRLAGIGGGNVLNALGSVAPLEAKIGLARLLSDPSTFINSNEADAWYRAHGMDPNARMSLIDKILGIIPGAQAATQLIDKQPTPGPAQQQESKYLSTLPWAEKAGINLATDPTTYLMAAGPVSKVAGAYSTLPEDATLMAKIAAIGKGTLTEARGLSGADLLTKPITGTYNVLTGRTAAIKEGISLVDTSKMMLEALTNGPTEIPGLYTATDRAAAESLLQQSIQDGTDAMAGRGRFGKPNLTAAKEAWAKAAALTGNTHMSDLSSSDAISQELAAWRKTGAPSLSVIRGQGNALIDARKLAHDTANAAAERDAAGALTPAEKMLRLADPSQMETSFARATATATKSHIEASTGYVDLLARRASALARDAFNFDGVTGLTTRVADAADGTKATMGNIYKTPSKFILDQSQQEAVHGWQQFLQQINGSYVKPFIASEADPKVAAAMEERMKAIISASPGPLDPGYVHHQAFMMGPAGADITDVSWLKRLTARLQLPTPLGTLKLPVNRIAGPEPESRLGKFIANFYNTDYAVPEGFNSVRQGPEGGIGAMQSFEKTPVVPEGGTPKQFIYNTDPGVMMRNYFGEVQKALTDEGITKKVLASFGVTDASLLSPLLQTEKEGLIASRNLGGQALAVLQSIANVKKDAVATGWSPKTVEKLRKLADAEKLPAPVVEALNGAADLVAAHLDAAQAATKGAEATARAGARAGETLMATVDKPTVPNDLVARGESPNPAIQPAKRMEQGAAAVTRAEDLVSGTDNLHQRVLDAQATLQNHVNDRAIPALEDHMAESKFMLDENKKAIADALVGRTTGTGLSQVNIPGLQGTWYDKVAANYIRDAYAAQSGKGLAGGLAQAQGVVQAVTAGQSFHDMFMQSFALIGKSVNGWMKAIAVGAAGMSNPDIYYRNMAAMASTYDKTSGLSYLELASQGGLHIGALENYSPDVIGEALRMSNDSVIGKIGGVVSRMPLNRAFTMQRNTAAMEMFRAMVDSETALGTDLSVIDNVKSIGRVVNAATGFNSTTAMGIGKTQATTERLLGRFGAQWFRSQTGRIITAAQVGTIDGRMSRELLFKQMTAMTALYVAASSAAGQTPHFDPSSKDFLSIQVGNNRVAFGGVYTSLMKATGQAVNDVANGNEGNLLDLKDGKNPLLNFWQNGAPLVGKMIADTVQAGLPGQGTSYQKNALQELYPQNIAPIDVQAGLNSNGNLLQRALAAAPAAVGLRDTPLTTTDIFSQTADQFAKEHGAADWASVPKAVQDKYLNDPNNAELKKAFDAKEQWFTDHGATGGTQGEINVFFDHYNRSVNAEGDTLTGLATKVLGGQMTAAQFRTEYNNWLTFQTQYGDHLKSAMSTDAQTKLGSSGGANLGTPQDILAAKYEAIQPVDTTGTGTPSAADWATWQGARNQFWLDNPAANGFRQYITTDYPDKKWAAFPVAKQMIDQLKSAQYQNSTYLAIPKYKGLSTSDGQFLDGVLSAKSTSIAQLTDMAIKAGVPQANVKIPAALAWQYTVQALQSAGVKITDRVAQLIKLAAVIDGNTQAKLKLINPQRLQYLQQNPSLVGWYPNAATETGIPTKILEALGVLTAAPGLTEAAKVANISSYAPQ